MLKVHASSTVSCEMLDVEAGRDFGGFVRGFLLFCTGADIPAAVHERYEGGMRGCK